MEAFVWETLTPSALLLGEIALLMTAFFRGWIVAKPTYTEITKLQNSRIEEAIKRGDDYKLAWELSEKRADVLQALVADTTSVGENVNKILNALPKGDVQ